MACMAPFPFLLQGARVQHLSSISLSGRIATAELVWIHYPEGSVEYIPHLCKEIMMKEKAEEEVDRKNPELSHKRNGRSSSCPAEREKERKYPRGMCWWECTEEG